VRIALAKKACRVLYSRRDSSRPSQRDTWARQALFE